jgi:hypothetical protein
MIAQPMSNLKLLWVNDNKITNLSTFIEQISKYCPNLKCLSMQKNKACPNFFNGGTNEQYQDYRYYVISRFPHLQELDITPVSKEEREEAMKKYGDLIIENIVTVLEEKKKKKIEKKMSTIKVTNTSTTVTTTPVNISTPVPVTTVPLTTTSVTAPAPPPIVSKIQIENVKPNVKPSKEKYEQIPTPFLLAGKLPKVDKDEKELDELPQVHSSDESE